MLGLCLAGPALFAQESDRVDLGRLQTGATVSFVRAATGGWGIEIAGLRRAVVPTVGGVQIATATQAGAAAPLIQQPEPARIEVFRAEADIRQLAAGYQTVRKSAAGVDAQAEITYGKKVTFHVQDHWTLNGAVVSVSRKVEVKGKAPGGFDSSVVFTVDPSVNWTNVNCLAPGALYGDPTYDGDRSPGGTLNYAARRFIMREDILPAPMFALSFSNGASVTMLDPAPRGDSTVAETKLSKDVMTDARFQFGALGAWQADNGPIEFGFRFPGTASIYAFGTNTPAKTRWIRRYHPIKQGVAHSYQVSFRFGQNESFRDVTRNSWRWAWDTLNPAVTYIDVEQMRRVLIDHLEAQVNTIDGRTAIPFVISTLKTNKVQWNYTMVAMGFVGKDIECADQLLREGDRDKTERGQKMRQTGLAIISTLIAALPTVPLQGTGFDLATGKPWTGDHQEWVAPWLRNATEDMRVLMRAYRREKRARPRTPGVV